MDTLTATAAMAALTRSSFVACFIFGPLWRLVLFRLGTLAMPLALAVRNCSYGRNLTIEIEGRDAGQALSLPRGSLTPLAGGRCAPSLAGAPAAAAPRSIFRRRRAIRVNSPDAKRTAGRALGRLYRLAALEPSEPASARLEQGPGVINDLEGE